MMKRTPQIGVNHSSEARVAGCLRVARLSVCLMLLTSPVVPALAETGKPPDKQAAARGAMLYKQYCESCHREVGVGEPVYPWHVGKTDYFPAPALNDSQHAWHHSDEDLVKIILKGSPRTSRMAAWKNVLSENDARNLVAYIKSLWSPRALACQGPRHMSCGRVP